MAAAPTPDPTAGAGPQAGPSPTPSPAGGEGAGLQAPGTPEMRALATLYQACKQLAQTNPVLAPGLSKAAQGIQEAQTALVSQPKEQPQSHTPPY